MHTLVLAMGRAEQKQSLGEVRTWLDKVGALAGQPVVYVTDALREKALSALNMGTKKPQVITHDTARRTRIVRPTKPGFHLARVWTWEVTVSFVLQGPWLSALGGRAADGTGQTAEMSNRNLK